MPDTLTGEVRGTTTGEVGVTEHTFSPSVAEGPSRAEAPPRLNSAQVGLWAFLATVTMLFAGFTSAYLVRRASPDWLPIFRPPLLWFNTGVLLLSSLTLEVAKTYLKVRRIQALKVWLLAGVALGLVFLMGQLLAWRELAAQGIFLPTSPHSSFFYMLTGVHGVHVLGGVCGLLYVLRWAWRWTGAPAEPNPLTLCATYWHFVTGIWIYLFLLLFVWR